MVDLVPCGYSSVSKFHECSYKDLGGSSLTAPFHFSFPLNMSALQPVEFMIFAVRTLPEVYYRSGTWALVDSAQVNIDSRT